jgi:hypothetical protein
VEVMKVYTSFVEKARVLDANVFRAPLLDSAHVMA